MKIRVVLLAAILFGVAPVSSYASTANELLRSCEILLRTPRQSEDTIGLTDAANRCFFYFMGIQDASLLIGADGKRMLDVCPPPQSRLTQLVRVFVEFARKNPAKLHLNAAGITVDALSEAFPCQ